MLKGGKEYFKLPFEYKDVFVWSCKEMVGLDPKVAVHNLSRKKGVLPKNNLNDVFILS